jgi:hypothetical protein
MNDSQQKGARTAAQGRSNLEAAFTSEQWHALVTLRDCYQRDHDLLSAREQTRLRFIRWLIDTGRVGS